MISGISGNNSIYSYQASINNYRLARALNNRYSGQSSVPPVTSVDRTSNSLSGSISYVKSYSSTMSDLMSSANSLRKANSSGVASELAISSSDTDILSAENRFRVTSPGNYELDVTQVATSQTNVSEAVDSLAAASDVSMNIQTASGRSLDISVSGLNEDGSQKTNKQLLSDVSKEINAANMGLKASVVTKDGKSSLEITSVNTGKGSQFNVTGDFAAQSGLDQVSQEAQNAEYTVTQGDVTKSYASSSNNISLDNGKISVTLKKEGSAAVSAAVDTDKVVSAIEDLVNNYNRATKLINANQDRGSGSYRQLNNLSLILGSKESQEKLGLSINKEGSLTLDKEKLTKSLKEDPKVTQDLISGSYGIAQRAFNGASKAMSTPVSSLIGNDIQQAEYENAVSSTNFMNSFSRTGAFNMSNYYAVGMMFNMLV